MEYNLQKKSEIFRYSDPDPEFWKPDPGSGAKLSGSATLVSRESACGYKAEYTDGKLKAAPKPMAANQVKLSERRSEKNTNLTRLPTPNVA